jgi:hypothetical protein
VAKSAALRASTVELTNRTRAEDGQNGIALADTDLIRTPILAQPNFEL